jgi:hypothetical protein
MPEGLFEHVVVHTLESLMCTTVHCNQAVRNQPSPKAPGLRSRTTSLVMANNRTGEASQTPPPIINKTYKYAGRVGGKVVVGRAERVVLSELGGRMSNPAESNHLLPAINTCQTNRNIQNRFQRNATQPPEAPTPARRCYFRFEIPKSRGRPLTSSTVTTILQLNTKPETSQQQRSTGTTTGSGGTQTPQATCHRPITFRNGLETEAPFIGVRK